MDMVHFHDSNIIVKPTSGTKVAIGSLALAVEYAVIYNEFVA